MSVASCFRKITLSQMFQKEKRVEGRLRGKFWVYMHTGMEEKTKTSVTRKLGGIAKSYRIVERILILELNLISNQSSSSYIQ
jgi:hypothetical protein